MKFLKNFSDVLKLTYLLLDVLKFFKSKTAVAMKAKWFEEEKTEEGEREIFFFLQLFRVVRPAAFEAGSPRYPSRFYYFGKDIERRWRGGGGGQSKLLSQKKKLSYPMNSLTECKEGKSCKYEER